MHTTSRLGLQVPDGTDNESAFPAVDAQAKGILDNAVIVTEGTFAARPAANTVEKDHIYKATDTGIWYIGDGTNWNTLLIAAAWQNLTLGTHIVAGTTPPQGRLVGDGVQLRGSFTQNSAGSIAAFTTLLTVPVALKPTALRGIALLDIVGTSSAGSVGEVQTGGAIVAAYSMGVSDTIYLDSATYTL